MMDLVKHIKPLNNEAEWPVWKRKIRDLLDYHEGALDAIDGKIKKLDPLEEGAKDAEVKKHKQDSDLYRKANSYAKSMITSAVTDAVYQKIMDKETAHDAWEELKRNFEASSRDQLFKICTDFFAFSWTSGEDVSTHIAKLRGLWNELNNGLVCKGESKLPDLILVCKVLHILPTHFESFKTGWMLLTRNEKKTFDELTVQLCTFERNVTRNVVSEKASHEALLVKSGVDNQSKVHNKQKPFNKIGNCNYCKKKGHWIKECRSWIADGRPPRKASWNKDKDKTETTNVTLVSINSDVFSMEVDKKDWWIDNGATRHVTNCSSYFVDFEEFQRPHHITAAGKETLTAVGKGSVRFLATVGNNTKEVTLMDVWYVPKIAKNLFSVLAAQDRNKKSKFESTVTNCTLSIGGQVRLVGTREIDGTMYRAAIEPIVPEREVEVAVAVDDGSDLLQLYHERWGHQNKRYVKEKLKRELGIVVKMNTELCEPCIYGKAHRLPFGTREKSTKPGELVSTDVCGPFAESFQKKRYLVVLKDNYTKFRYGYIVAKKSEVSEVLKDFLLQATNLGHTVKELLSDNGGEFDNAETRAILRARGVKQRLTAPYTPEQNGICERDNRTIVEMARTLKYSNPDVSYPEAIWAELVNSAIYILNRTGKSSVEGLSPYELWTNKQPRIKHLRIIGCTCYAHIPSQKRKKMDQKAVKGRLIGYDGDERYRIWLKESNKVILSRDVQFEEIPGSCVEHVQLPLPNPTPEEPDENGSEPGLKNDNGRHSDTEDSAEEFETENETDGDDVQEEQKETPAHSLRNRLTLKKPKFYDDYVMAAEAVNPVKTPQTYEEALEHEESAEWKRAMDREIDSLKENQTWELDNLPSGGKAIPCKWVFRLKTNADGSINKYKARLVAKGFVQRQGVDYGQTFSPVAKMSTIRSVLSIAASENMHLAQFDVSTAFLYGELEEMIYMAQPKGYHDDTSRVCRLRKSLYGLKQAPRCWNKRFGNFLFNLGFKTSEADPCLYIQDKGGSKLMLILYVDDGLVAATDQRDLGVLFDKLKTEFKITTSDGTFFLGLQIQQSSSGIKINQKTYAQNILKRFNFSECNAVSTPMVKSTKQLQSGKDDGKLQEFPYREAVGALMYLMLGTRPDLAFSVSFLSRSLENPTTEDITRLKRVFRYIAGTTDLGILYKSAAQNSSIECYSDADFGGCSTTGRSTSGVVMMYAGGAISWLSQRQAMVATSTTEAELVAAHEAVKEIIWLTRLFAETMTLKTIPILQVDNAAAVKLALNPEFHRRTKHISMKYFFIREKLAEGRLDVQQISTHQQVADVMTKPIPKIRLRFLNNKMGLL